MMQLLRAMGYGLLLVFALGGACDQKEKHEKLVPGDGVRQTPVAAET